ncbi:MAG TPA: hypothetical protein PLV68_18300, partial [Ilumatobacteraceae bacterium]|nr:hypothetical protein [Ilumatobacteraceae bacterium]
MTDAVITPTNTFRLSRSQLEAGPDGGLAGTAVFATEVVASAASHVTITLVQAASVLRWDLWVGPDGAVVHPVGDGPDDELTGAVVATGNEALLVAGFVTDAFGQLAVGAASEPGATTTLTELADGVVGQPDGQR